MQYSGRLPEGIQHQSWSPEHIHVILITTTDRQKTDKQNHTMSKNEKGTKGIRTQAQLNVVSQTFDNILNIAINIKMKLCQNYGLINHEFLLILSKRVCRYDGLESVSYTHLTLPTKRIV